MAFVIDVTQRAFLFEKKQLLYPIDNCGRCGSNYRNFESLVLARPPAFKFGRIEKLLRFNGVQVPISRNYIDSIFTKTEIGISILKKMSYERYAYVPEMSSPSRSVLVTFSIA